MDNISSGGVNDYLVIAPRTDLLYVDSEVSAVINLLNARLLQGPVTYDDIVDEVEKYKPKVLWFSTHGVEVGENGADEGRGFRLVESGILLSGAKILTTTLLVPLFNLSEIDFVFLNTCHSLGLALALQAELNVSFLTTIREVPDELAFRTAKNFAIQLSRGMDYHTAWVRARPGRNSTFVYLAGNPKPMPSTTPSSHSAEGEINGVETLKRLVAVINGDPKWNTPGILPILNGLQSEMQRLRWSIMFLRIVCVLLFAMNLFTMFALYFLVRILP